MPTLDATTTATFASTGISASTIYDVMKLLTQSAVSFGLWLLQVAFPFLLVISFIYLMWRLVHKYMHFGR